MHKKYLESLYILTKPILQKRLYRSGVRCYTLSIKGKEIKTMTREEMNKMERLAEIMFQEDEERYNNNQPLMYYTEEDFEAEREERRNNR